MCVREIVCVCVRESEFQQSNISEVIAELFFEEVQWMRHGQFIQESRLSACTKCYF